MNATAKQITYKATFTQSILGPVLTKLTRSGRALDLASLPAGCEDYLCVTRPNPSAPWRFTDENVTTWEQFVALDTVKESRKVKTRMPQATVEFKIEQAAARVEAEPLPRSWHDGAHCGLTDWYPELEAAIVEALARGKRAPAWTTDWYGSKKEIASARITCAVGQITVEVSVSDDFDTEGRGEVTIPFTANLDKIRAAVDAAWDNASDEQRENRVYQGYSVGRGKRWEFTVIVPVGLHLDVPPGDNYHRWGWQEVEDGEDHPAAIPAKTAQSLLDWARAGDGERRTIGGWTIRRWED